MSNKLKQLKSMVGRNLWKALPAGARTRIIGEIAKRHAAVTAHNLSGAIKGVPVGKHQKDIYRTYRGGQRAMAKAKTVSDLDAFRALHERAYNSSPTVFQEIIEQSVQSPAQALLSKRRYLANIGVAKALNPQTDIKKLMKMDPFTRAETLQTYRDMTRSIPRELMRTVPL